MSGNALNRYRRIRREQRIGQKTVRRNRIRNRHRMPDRRVVDREPTGAVPVVSLNCGICNRKLRAGHRESGLCKRCFDLDTRSLDADLAAIGLMPTQLDLVCAAFDHEED